MMLPSGVPLPGDTKVFVGGLGWQTTPQSLQVHFSQYGEIEEVKLIMDKQTGRSKGYGFVQYCMPESAIRAVANPFPIIDGKQANCNLASANAKPPGMQINQKRPFPYSMNYMAYASYGATAVLGLQEKLIGNHWIVTPLQPGPDLKRRKTELTCAQQLLAQLAQEKKEQESKVC
eukprot:TRINITY_DN4325_c1_g1_i4.p1 TRINITY_DN4325_c1_g1~~TRINITY_DN4325_c1_g1_i4.p1  ORF type:complete len:175 (+),score=35.81 TRINITY_DN4325_c1_g1_i4:103-627(+)